MILYIMCPALATSRSGRPSRHNSSAKKYTAAAASSAVADGYKCAYNIPAMHIDRIIDHSYIHRILYTYIITLYIPAYDTREIFVLNIAERVAKCYYLLLFFIRE